MKAARLGNATRTVGKIFFGLALLLLAVGLGFGGTALVVYHQLGGSRPADQRMAERARPDRKEAPRPAPVAAGTVTDDAQPRRVAATMADASSYTFADNTGGQPSAPVKRQKPAAASVPGALATPAQSDEEPAANSSNDPESHYIVDSRTGCVIGIDGSAGARREAEEEQRLLNAAPRAVAVQTPPPEVRVASAVTDAGQPIYHDVPSANITQLGSENVPVRRAMPATPDFTEANPRGFNVADYLADDRNRPALRAQSVNAPGVRTARAAHVFRLPDGTQAVVTD